MNLHSLWIKTHKHPPKKGARIIGFIYRLYEHDIHGCFSGQVEMNENLGCLVFVNDAGGWRFLSDMPLYFYIQDPPEKLQQETADDFYHEDNS